LCCEQAARPAADAAMTTARPDNAAIFHGARDILDPDRRRAYDRAARGGDKARIAAQVEALLQTGVCAEAALVRKN
jgi:hypothetical protein